MEGFPAPALRCCARETAHVHREPGKRTRPADPGEAGLDVRRRNGPPIARRPVRIGSQTESRPWTGSSRPGVPRKMRATIATIAMSARISAYSARPWPSSSRSRKIGDESGQICHCGGSPPSLVESPAFAGAGRAPGPEATSAAVGRSCAVASRPDGERTVGPPRTRVKTQRTVRWCGAAPRRGRRNRRRRVRGARRRSCGGRAALRRTCRPCERIVETWRPGR